MKTFSRPVSFVAAAAVAAMCVSCSTVRQVRPLAKGESSATLSVGGPVTQIGNIYIPIPMLSIGYNYGLIDSLVDIETGWHVTHALYGVMGLEAGANWRPLKNRRFRPGLIVSPKVFFLTDFSPESVRFYPDLGVTALWQVRAFWHVFTGMESWFELHSRRSDGNGQEYHWLPVPYVGCVAGNGKWQFQIECRLYTPNLKNTGRATKNIGAGEYGIWGVMLGVSRAFGPFTK